MSVGRIGLDWIYLRTLLLLEHLAVLIKGESRESRIPGTQGYWQALFWKLTVFYIDWTQMLYMCLPATISVWQTAFQIFELSLPAIHGRLICMAALYKVPARPSFRWYLFLLTCENSNSNGCWAKSDCKNRVSNVENMSWLKRQIEQELRVHHN